MRKRYGCVECGEELKEGVYTTTIYDKCRGKTCPDCGKVRKLGTVEVVDLSEGTFFKCLKCGEMKRYFIRRSGKKDESVCQSCFLEREGKSGCICYDKKPFLLCPICDEVHERPVLCEKCLKKQTASYQRKQTFFKVILPTAIISLVIGFFLGWLFFRFRKLRKGKTTSPFKK